MKTPNEIAIEIVGDVNLIHLTFFDSQRAEKKLIGLIEEAIRDERNAAQPPAPAIGFLPEAAAVIKAARKFVKHRGSMQSYYDLEDVLISALDALDAAQGKNEATESELEELKTRKTITR